MTEDRASIIRTVQTPLGFFTLLVLVTEVILGGLALRAEGWDFTILIIGMILLLFGLTWVVYRTAGQNPSPNSKATNGKRKYDVFLSSVLAGFNDDSRLLEEREFALQVAGTVERECEFRVYYAGREVHSMDEFDPSKIGPSKDLDALRSSRYFVMLYPERMLSSVIFEAGLALEHCESSIYFVRNEADLPYLMRHLPKANPRVQIIKYKDVDGVTRLVRQHRGGLFDFPKSPESIPNS